MQGYNFIIISNVFHLEVELRRNKIIGHPSGPFYVSKYSFKLSPLMGQFKAQNFVNLLGCQTQTLEDDFKLKKRRSSILGFILS